MCHIPAVNSCHCVKYSTLVDLSIRTMTSAVYSHQLKYLTLSRDMWFFFFLKKCCYMIFSTTSLILKSLSYTVLWENEADPFLSLDIRYNFVTLMFKSRINWRLGGLQWVEIIFVSKNDTLPWSSNFIYFSIVFFFVIALCCVSGSFSTLILVSTNLWDKNLNIITEVLLVKARAPRGNQNKSSVQLKNEPQF